MKKQDEKLVVYYNEGMFSKNNFLGSRSKKCLVRLSEYGEIVVCEEQTKYLLPELMVLSKTDPNYQKN